MNLEKKVDVLLCHLDSVLNIDYNFEDIYRNVLRKALLEIKVAEMEEMERRK